MRLYGAALWGFGGALKKIRLRFIDYHNLRDRYHTVNRRWRLFQLEIIKSNFKSELNLNLRQPSSLWQKAILLMLIYFDNCSYNRPFDDQNQMRIFLEAQAKMYIQGLIRDKKISLACSYMSFYENNDNPNAEHREIIADFLTNAIVYLDYDKAATIEKLANELMKLKLKKKDAIHLASAIEAQCNCFISTDDGILKKHQDLKAQYKIRVCSPVDFLNILEEPNA